MPDIEWIEWPAQEKMCVEKEDGGDLGWLGYYHMINGQLGEDDCEMIPAAAYFSELCADQSICEAGSHGSRDTACWMMNARCCGRDERSDTTEHQEAGQRPAGVAGKGRQWQRMWARGG